MTLANEQMAREKMEEVIQARVRSAADIAERIMSVVPTDTVVRASALGFAPKQKGVITLVAKDNEWTMHPNAFGQVAEKAGVPTQWASKQLNGWPWEVELLAHVLRTTYSHSDGRHLLRAVPGDGGAPQVRGFLSDKFRRLDSRPILDAFIVGARDMGAVPYEGHATAVRAGFKVLVPQVHAIPQRWTDAGGVQRSQSEYVAIGAEFGNSDFGVGRLSIRSFLLRLTCLNGATAEDVMRKTHVGARLEDDVEYSQKTYELDTKTTTSAVKDLMRHVLAEQARLKLFARTESAMAENVEWKKLRASLAKTLTKGELDKAEAAFESPDVVNLPPGENAWRASNAFSWVAQQADNAERRMELERIAGQLAFKTKEAA